MAQAQPFNAEQFRQSMRGEATAGHQNISSPVPHPYPTPQVPPHMPVQPAAPSAPQALEAQPYLQPQFQASNLAQYQAPMQAQAAPQPYSPAAAAQPQHWGTIPQTPSQAVPAQSLPPQMAPQHAEMVHMQQAPAFAPPVAAAAATIMDGAPKKKTRFNFKRLKNKAALNAGPPSAEMVNSETVKSDFALRPFLLGVLTGVAVMLVGVVLL